MARRIEWQANVGQSTEQCSPNDAAHENASGEQAENDEEDQDSLDAYAARSKTSGRSKISPPRAYAEHLAKSRALVSVVSTTRCSL